jgi:hypothetical protein
VQERPPEATTPNPRRRLDIVATTPPAPSSVVARGGQCYATAAFVAFGLRREKTHAQEKEYTELLFCGNTFLSFLLVLAKLN